MRALVCNLLVLCLLAGCARFRSEPIVPAETAAKLEARTLASPAFREFLEHNHAVPPGSWPPDAWDFETLNLAALYYHPSLDVARAQWQVAQGGDKTAAGRPNPTVSAVPGISANPARGMSPWLPMINFDLPLETAGKRGYRMAQARSLSESARLNISSTAWQVRSSLRTSLLDFSFAHQRERLLQKQKEHQEKIIHSLEQRLKAGAVASSELTLVLIALNQIRLDLVDAQQQEADARVRVADSIGIPVSALEGLDFGNDLPADPSSAAALSSAEARRQALQSRSDVLGALAEYAARQSALQLEIAKQYPDIHLGPGYQYNQGDHEILFTVSAELPVLNQNQGPIAEARARRTEAAARFTALQGRVITDIDRAIAAYRVAQQNLSAVDSLAALQRERSDSIQAQIKAGAAEQLDLLNSQLELGATELLRLSGRMKLEQSLAALENAIQRPIDSIRPALIEPMVGRDSSRVVNERTSEDQPSPKGVKP